MNILFLTLLDFSNLEEKGIYTDLLREFLKDKHSVYVVSPSEKRKNLPTRLLDKGDYKILKLKIGNIQKTGTLEKAASTFLLGSQYKKSIKIYFNNVKFDLVLYSTPPITLCKAVEYVRKRDSAKTYLLLKDIFPQNALDLGMLTNSGAKGLAYRHFRKNEKRLYQISDHIGCMSEANVQYLLKNNSWLPREKVEVCPNSIDPTLVEMTDNEKVDILHKYEIPSNKIIFVYGGNLGKPQGVDFLIECIRNNERNEKTYFLIVGSGTEFHKVKSFFDNEKPKNAKLMKELPAKEYEALANACDVGLILLDRRFTIPNFPSRILSYMQASMPVLAATDVNTDIGKVITKNEFGLWCESGDVKTFFELVRHLCQKEHRIRMGNNARNYLMNYYTSKNSYDIIMKHYKNPDYY